MNEFCRSSGHLNPSRIANAGDHRPEKVIKTRHAFDTGIRNSCMLVFITPVATELLSRHVGII